MDITPGKKETSLNPKSAIEDAMLRIATALDDANLDYKALSLLSIRKRFFLQGVITSLTVVLELLHNLHHKYDNSRGELN